VPIDGVTDGVSQRASYTAIMAEVCARQRVTITDCNECVCSDSSGYRESFGTIGIRLVEPTRADLLR
jgi:hypothetical protein